MAFSVRTIRMREPERIYPSINWGEKIIRYDTDNAYPQRTLRILEASPTGVACRDTMVDFVYGGGFQEQDFRKAIINRKGQSIAEIHRELTVDFANHAYFAVHLNYNLAGQVQEISRVEPQYIRLGLPDSTGFSPLVAVYDDWYKDNKQRIEQHRRIDYINVFNPSPEALQKQIDLAGGIYGYFGQILVFWGSAQGYPKTWYDSVLNDLKVDYKIGRKNKNDLDTDYTAGTILMFGDKLEETERRIKQAELREVQGTDGQRILLLDGVGEGGLKLITLQNNFSDTQYLNTEETTRRRIMRAFSQLPILHGEDRANALSSDGKAIENAYKFYNKKTARLREVVSNFFSKIVPFFKDPINPGGNFDILPLQYESGEIEKEFLPVLSVNERRGLISFPPLEEEEAKAEGPTLAEKLGVGGLGSLLEVIQATGIEKGQKEKILVAVFGLSEEEARQIVPDDKREPTQILGDIIPGNEEDTNTSNSGENLPINEEEVNT